MHSRATGGSVVTLLLLSVLPHSIIVPTTPASAVILSIYGIVGIVLSVSVIKHIRHSSWPKWLSPTPLFSVLALGTIAGLYLYHVILGNYNDLTNAIAAIAIIGVAVANLFIIPRLLSVETFLSAVSRFAALLVLVGALMIGLTSLDVISEALLWRSSTPLYLSSITTNPNILGRITFAGLIASVAEYERERNGMSLVLTAIIGAGLFLTNSQASWAAAIVAITIYAAYRIAGRQGVGLVTLLVYMGTLAGIVAVVAWVSFFGADITLSGRLVLWEASVRAMVDQPLGYGHGYTGDYINPFFDDARFDGDAPHNSYLRVGVISGIIGFCAYLVLVFGSLVYDYRRGIASIAIFAIAVGFSINQLFESHTLLGYTSHTIINALVVGYLLAPSTEQFSTTGSRKRYSETKPWNLLS